MPIYMVKVFKLFFSGTKRPMVVVCSIMSLGLVCITGDNLGHTKYVKIINLG